jgi:hypothetical protein
MNPFSLHWAIKSHVVCNCAIVAKFGNKNRVLLLSVLITVWFIVYKQLS